MEVVRLNMVGLSGTEVRHLIWSIVGCKLLEQDPLFSASHNTNTNCQTHHFNPAAQTRYLVFSSSSFLQFYVFLSGP